MFQSLWREVPKYPLNTKLKREDSYCFMFVNKVGEKVSQKVTEGSSVVSELP